MLDIKQLNRDNYVVNGFNNGVTVTLGLICKFVNTNNKICWGFSGKSVVYMTSASLRGVANEVDKLNKEVEKEIKKTRKKR